MFGHSQQHLIGQRKQFLGGLSKGRVCRNVFRQHVGYCIKIRRVPSRLSPSRNFHLSCKGTTSNPRASSKRFPNLVSVPPPEKYTLEEKAHILWIPGHEMAKDKTEEGRPQMCPPEDEAFEYIFEIWNNHPHTNKKCTFAGCDRMGRESHDTDRRGWSGVPMVSF